MAVPYPTVNTSVLKPMVRPALLPRNAGYKRGFDVLEDEKRNNRTSKYRQQIRLSVKNVGSLDVDWSADGRWMLVLSPDGLRTVDTEKEPAREDRVFPGAYVSAKIDPTDPNIVAALGHDGKLIITKAFSGGIKELCHVDLEKMDKGMKAFTALEYSPNGNQIALSTSHNCVFTFNVVKGETISLRSHACIDIPSLNRDMITAVKFDNQGDLWIACGTTPGKIWRYKHPFRKHDALLLAAHRGPALCLALDRVGKYVASGGADGLISIWDAQTAEQVSAITKPDQAVVKVTLNSDGSLVAYTTGSLVSDRMVGDRWFYVANVQTRQVIFADHQRSSMCNMKWCPRTNRLAYFTEEDEVPQQQMPRFPSDRYRVSSPATARHAYIIRVPDRM